jgi:hypothetical protein
MAFKMAESLMIGFQEGENRKKIGKKLLKMYSMV